MTDILQVLREASQTKDDYYAQAADEIERLRAYANQLYKELLEAREELKTWIDHSAQQAEEIERLRSQLPATMKHCTIEFKECEKGHGRLTATNWVDNGCQWCEIERLRAALETIAGTRQGPDSLLSDKEIARSALGHKP